MAKNHQNSESSCFVSEREYSENGEETNDHLKMYAEDRSIHPAISNAHMSEKGNDKDEVNDIRIRFPDVFKKSLRIRLERVKDASVQRKSAVDVRNSCGNGNHFFSPKFSKSIKGIVSKAFKKCYYAIEIRHSCYD